VTPAGQPGAENVGPAISRVTGLAPDPRRAGAVRVEIDHVPFGTIARETMAAEGLQLGTLIEGGLRERLEAAADAEAAYRTALRVLERRPYATADLGRRLARKGHPAAAIRDALERATSAGLLNDAEFVLNYVQTRAARGRGPSRLTRDLLAMGVERKLIDRALSVEWEAGRDHAVPLALATRRSTQLGDLPRPIKRRRLLAYLARRGFTGRDVTDMVGRLVG
jgi:regulatory protein